MSSAFKFSSKICTNNVTNCDQTIQYDLCNSWVHIEYNDLNYIDYKFFQNSNDPWFFTQAACCKIFSFNTAKKNENFNFYDSNNKSKETDDKNSSLLLKPSEHLKQLVNQF